MAGSYRHITNSDGSFRGVELLDHLGDALEALEECYEMINYLTGGDRIKIYEAWRNGYLIKHYPKGNPGTCEEYWDDDDEE